MHCTLPIYMGDKKTESVCESTAASGTQAHTDSYQSHQWLSETNVLSQIYHSPLLQAEILSAPVGACQLW